MPAFFDRVPRLRVRDPLAELLGCAEGGVLEYGYADVVRLTGHSCPTVAAAYWLTLRALRELCGSALPERGGIEVRSELGRLWQQRVRQLLLDLPDDPAVFQLRRVQRATPAAIATA